MKIKIFTILLLLGCTNINFAQSKKLVIKQKVEVLGSLAREPMFAEHPSGTLFMTGYHNAVTIPQLWKSTDKGETWNKVNVGTKAEGAHANSDADLVIDPDGVIYLLSMKYTEIPPNLPGFDMSKTKGEHIVLGISKDEGKTWKWRYISQNPYDDRPWIEIASDKTVHIIWNDGKGVHYATSRDQGQTWQKRPDIYSKGGSSHFAAGPKGQLAVRISPSSASGHGFDKGVDLLRLSLDFGKTWSEAKLPGNRKWEKNVFKGTPRWVEPIAWDSQGRLYYLWSEGKRLVLGRSADNGKTWETWQIVKNKEVVYFPYLTVTHNKVACTWVARYQKKVWHNAAIVDLSQKKPVIARLAPQQLEIYSNTRMATGGEYFPIKRLKDGDYGMATVIQNIKNKRVGFTWWRLRYE